MKVNKFICQLCGKEFERRPKSGREHKFCSRACNGAYHRKTGSVEVVCQQCGKAFSRWRSNIREAIFCSQKCHGVYQQQNAKQRIEVTCDWCKKPYKTWNCIVQKRKHLFCSVGCSRNFQSKQTNPDHYKSYSDQSNALVNFGANNKMGDSSPKRFETRKKIRETMLAKYGVTGGYERYFGKLGHRWVVEELILGRSLSPDEVVHHIDFDKRNNNPSNLAVMTRSEHARLHKELGKK